MRKYIKILAVAGVLFPGIAFAEISKTEPTCEELGYLSTPAKCGNIPSLKCPSNPNKVYCGGDVDCNVEYGHLIGKEDGGGYVYFVGRYYSNSSENQGKCIKYIGKVIDHSSSDGQFAESWTNACKTKWQSDATARPSKLDGMGTVLFYTQKIMGYMSTKPNNTPTCPSYCQLGNVLSAMTYGNSNADPGAKCGLYNGSYSCLDGNQGTFTWLKRVCNTDCSGTGSVGTVKLLCHRTEFLN